MSGEQYPWQATRTNETAHASMGYAGANHRRSELCPARYGGLWSMALALSRAARLAYLQI